MRGRAFSAQSALGPLAAVSVNDVRSPEVFDGETRTFAAAADKLWVRLTNVLEFLGWLASNADAGDVIPRKRRLPQGALVATGQHQARRGSRRPLKRLPAGEIWLLVLYAKSTHANIPPHLLKQIREEIEHG
jgi:hypothetical protein